MRDFLVNLSVKSKIWLLAILGFSSSFAFAPYYYVWILCISLPILVLFLFYSKSYAFSILSSYMFGFFFFLGGLYWIANALFVDIDAYLYLVPIAVAVIPAILALYFIAFAAFLHYFNNNHALRFFILFVCGWVLIEILRTYLFTGFPWLAVGYSLMFEESLIQSASIFGVFGLSIIGISFASIPFLLLHTSKENIFVTISLAIMFVLNGAFGWYRLKAPTEYYDHYITLVQPNISQQDKIKPSRFSDNLNQLVSLTQTKSYNKSGYIVWPETALGGYYELPVVRKIINNIVPPNNYLITGVERFHNHRVYNSVVAYNDEGKVVAYHDKFHLVPFGEYLPFRKWFPEQMYNISNGLIDFEAGDGPYTMSLGTLPSFSPLICYESLFPKEIIHDKVRPMFLINFTNDAWYGDTPGPYQHFDMTRLRAVEYGIPMVRVANTGISATVDSYGRIKAYLSLNTSGVIQQKIPSSLKNISIFSQFGNSIVVILLVIITVVNIFLYRERYT